MSILHTLTQHFVTALVFVITFNVAFAAPPPGASIMIAFSITSHQALSKFPPSPRSLTSDKDQLPVGTPDILCISQALTSLQKQALKHKACTLLLHALASSCLRDSQPASYLPRPACCGNSEHLLSSHGGKPPLFQMHSPLPVFALQLLAFSVYAISATLLCVFPAGWG